MASRTTEFQSIRSEGGLLPPDLLRRVLDPKSKLEGARSEDYGLAAGERLNEAVTQSWNRLRKYWAEFRSAAANLPAGDAGTGLTNDKWTLPLLRELGFGPLPATAGEAIGGRTYAINRFLGPVPIHLVGCGLSLDRRAAGVRGAAVANPHGLVQEFLNRSDGHLWAIVSNGLRLRVLRDNQALSRQSFLEFDLDAMFDGEVFSDFVLLWLMAHATRFLPREGSRPETCWLEQWTKVAEEQGTRALGALRLGVQNALQFLGQGFTEHPRNVALRDALRSGQVPLVDFHGQLLRVVYRLIFLFVAEDRPIDGQPLLHPRDDSDHARAARHRYAEHYGTGRLRELAGAIKGSRHGDLWRQFQVIVGALSGDERGAKAREHLALPVLGSFLWDPASTATLNDAELTNHDFLEALRNLAFTRQGKVLRPVDYRSLGAEELGGVYESLLALTPQISADGARFTFAEFAGNERKTSGSYYTPDSLVQCLLDSALDPVVEDAIRSKAGAEVEKALLALKVCDPAVGSGHFLVGAAHRLARHLARARANAQGESEASPLLYQHALRDVIGRCLYGVDINPMAAELCRVSLWLEALEPGKPLSFLDHHIRVGNSLLGATPELISAGVPDEAFAPIEGDDKKACAVLKKRNKAERKGIGPLFAVQEAEAQAQLQQAAAGLERLPEDRPEEVRAKELAFRGHEHTGEYRRKKALADAWCSAFVIEKRISEPGRESSAVGITQAHLNALAEGRALPEGAAAEVERLAGQYQFFQWHLVFPEVFGHGGFDCVLGNPPWERVKLQEREFFDVSCPEIANSRKSSTRKNLVERLKTEAPVLYGQFLDAAREAEGEAHYLGDSGAFPLCGHGDINLYAVFAEQMRRLLHNDGRVGCIVPTGIATDFTTVPFFRQLIEDRTLVSLYDFRNSGFFESVAGAQGNRFCLLTIAGRARAVAEFSFLFRGTTIDDLGDEARRFALATDDFALLNPNTKTCPVFRGARDATLTKGIYRRIPVIIDESVVPPKDGWLLADRIRRVLDMGSAAVSARCTAEVGENCWKIYEAKMIHQFDHRFGDYSLVKRRSDKGVRQLPQAAADMLVDPSYGARPRYWVPAADVEASWGQLWSQSWLVVWRDITSGLDERTVIAAVIPRAGTDFTLRVGFSPLVARHPNCFVSNLNSFAFDYCARQKIGGTHLADFVLKQLPALPPEAYVSHAPWSQSMETFERWLLPRALELTYTAWELQSFAEDCGWCGPPFRWDEERRSLLRCEVDAAFFHLYLPPEANGGWRQAGGETPDDLQRLKASFARPRDAVAHIMDTFPIVRRKDEEKWGEYRTKRVTLEIYDEMQAAIAGGGSYHTRLDPPPADPLCRHPPAESQRFPSREG